MAGLVENEQNSTLKLVPDVATSIALFCVNIVVLSSRRRHILSSLSIISLNQPSSLLHTATSLPTKYKLSRRLPRGLHIGRLFSQRMVWLVFAFRK